MVPPRDGLASRVSQTVINLDEQHYRDFFRRVTDHDPFDYQIEVARVLFKSGNVVLRAPTGAGKTWSVIVPFLFSGWVGAPSRLIYALPLRTLAQGIYYEAQQAAARAGHSVDAVLDAEGRETVPPCVTLQTGEQPDDPFFDRGKIIVTTYDQVLSGLLAGPYGLSDRLRNINAAAIAGALLVFDEFHLMEPSKAFLTGIAGLHLFRELSQSVWMTATATRPLIAMLQEALGATLIPRDEQAAQELQDSLPSVTQVAREVRNEDSPLTADAVWNAHHRRSIVLLNTVGRAQAMFEALLQKLAAAGGSAQLMLLHSRFFKPDRAAKEQGLRRLLAKSGDGNVILVATQVVEAGLDISCEHLHTELCPMNSLVQRAGRCARFPGERGVVHVHPLPDVPMAWLPYGDLRGPEAALTKTQEILRCEGGTILKPDQAARWVERAHEQEDSDALRSGWHERLDECVRRIEQNVIVGPHAGVAHLIREGSDQVRVIVRQQIAISDRPGGWEGISLSRRSLARLLRNAAKDAGWFWTGDDSNPWSELRTEKDLASTYAVCLKPSVAAYRDDLGIQLGSVGTVESHPRKEPPRPGYAPLRMETWADHTRRVAAQAEDRLASEGWPHGLVSRGSTKRYDFNAESMRKAVRACALLHDLGKLQETWQRWAEAAQKARDHNYLHVAPLAHTDFDPESHEDRERARNLGIRRPAHAAASAYYGLSMFTNLLDVASSDNQHFIKSLCTAAVLAHHGGWLPPAGKVGADLGIAKLIPKWEEAVGQVLQRLPDAKLIRHLETQKDKRRTADDWLALTTDADNLRTWWPLIAYVTRTLRLSDQRATREGGSDE